MQEPELSLIIPLFNEAASIGDYIPSLAIAFSMICHNWELILVDNGSWDNTPQLLARLQEHYPMIRIVTVNRNIGYGWGIISGIRQARGRVIGYSDGDGQIAVDDLAKVYREFIESGCDLGKAYRVNRADGYLRKTVSSLYNLSFRLLFKTRVRDVNAKPKFMTKELVERLNLRSKDWFIDAEVVIGSRDSRVMETAISFQPRQRGSSNVRLGAIVEFVINMIREKRRYREIDSKI